MEEAKPGARRYLAKQKATLLCCNDCQCPTVTFGKEAVVITDDLGGRVRLTPKEFALLKKKVKEGKL